MPAIPLPFVVSGLLLLVLLRLFLRRSREVWFLIFIAACAVQTLLVGLRWSLGFREVHLVQPLLASVLPLIALTAFLSLRGQVPSPWHLLWPPAVVLSRWLWPGAVDVLLIVEFIAYGIAILTLRLPGEVLTQVRIGDEWAISAARIGVATLLLLSAISDAVVAMALSGGKHAVAGPAIAAVMGVMILGLAGGLLGWSSAATPNDPAPEVAPGPSAATQPETEEDLDAGSEVLSAVEAVLARGLYRDPDLTLDRLARRSGIPARKISRAVNGLMGCSLTDLVNGYRVREAMRLLRDTDLPVTQVMFDAGFQTKSNFNRAFKAIAGQTPTAYRSTGTG